jgi:hypothetical protein
VLCLDLVWDGVALKAEGLVFSVVWHEVVALLLFLLEALGVLLLSCLAVRALAEAWNETLLLCLHLR